LISKRKNKKKEVRGMGMLFWVKHYDNYVNKRTCIICQERIKNINEAEFDDSIGVWICSRCRKLLLTFCDNCKKPILRSERYYVLNDAEFNLAKKIFCERCITVIN
jgi:hypothetical protein